MEKSTEIARSILAIIAATGCHDRAPAHREASERAADAGPKRGPDASLVVPAMGCGDSPPPGPTYSDPSHDGMGAVVRGALPDLNGDAVSEIWVTAEGNCGDTVCTFAVYDGQTCRNLGRIDARGQVEERQWTALNVFAFRELCLFEHHQRDPGTQAMLAAVGRRGGLVVLHDGQHAVLGIVGADDVLGPLGREPDLGPHGGVGLEEDDPLANLQPGGGRLEPASFRRGQVWLPHFSAGA